MTRALSINIHDASFGIWQDDANDPTFRTEIYGALLKRLRSLGWSTKADPQVLKHYRCLSKDHRLASCGSLFAEIRLSGRVVELSFWAETWPKTNSHGHRYDFDRMAKFDYLDRLRVQLLRRRLIAWLRTIADVTVMGRNSATVARGCSTAVQAIEADYAESWHSDKTLGRPVSGASYNCTSADKLTIEHGSVVWFVGRGGRIGRGTALYHINNMWWVVCGKYLRHNLSTGDIFCHPPADLRVKRNARQRRERLEAEMATAIRRMDFRRAETLKLILFGGQPAWTIWARDHDAYYRSNYSGYTTDVISAGKYTREEAEREVRRVPHELEAHGPNGERLRFDREVAA